MGFNFLTRFVKDGEPVSAGVTNRAPQTIDANVRYLWDLIQAAQIGSTVYAWQQTLEAAAEQGMAVYFNPTTKRFERGLALVQANVSGVLETALSAQVWGIVANKTDTTLGDILLFGWAEVDISAAVDAPVTAGTYYLSGVNAGVLTKQKPPVSVAVLRADGNGKVFVQPQFIDFLDRHTHYRFDLTCRPAGDTEPLPPGGHHVITHPDVSKKGWLPANHSSFQGLAPIGAKFGYNFLADASLKNAWPPLPISSATLEWDKAVPPHVGFAGVPEGLCILDRNGIWWMSDCEGDVPWPELFRISDSIANSQSISESDSQGICLRDMQMALRLWFTKVNFATDVTLVRSLTPGDKRIKIHCLGTDTDATAGDLVIDLDLNFLVQPNKSRGYVVLKGFDPVTETFPQGDVMEGVYAISNNITLSGIHIPLDPALPNGKQLYVGPVGLEVTTQPTMEADVQLVRLSGVKEEFYQDTMYLGFTTGEAQSYRAKIQVPADLTLPSPQLALRLVILGRAAGVLPSLTVTARRIPRPVNGLVTPANLPTSGDEFSVTITTTATLPSSNQYVEAVSSPFAVEPGDIVLYTVSRTASDGYNAEVGILEQVGILSSEG